MNKKLLPFAALIITACSTTPAKLLETTPIHTFMSDLSPKVVADCIVKEWDAINAIGSPPIVSVRETKEGQRVMLYNGDKISYMAEVVQRAKGSRTGIYTHMVITFGEDPVVKKVERCQISI